MKMQRYMVSFLLMLIYSLPFLLVLGLIGHWIDGGMGSWIAVGVFSLALLQALSPQARFVQG